MKHWQETARVVERVLRLGREGQPSALAVVTRIRGSAYRRPGAKLLIEPDGGVLGGVSGGCLEQDVRQVGLEVLRGGRARTLHYDTSDDESRAWGLGLGCNGQVDLLVHPIPAPMAATFWLAVHDLLEGDTRFALGLGLDDASAIALDGAGRLAAGSLDAAQADARWRDSLLARGTGLRDVGSQRLFVEVLAPPPKLLVCGAGDDAVPLVALGASIGFRVFVADHRPAFLEARRFPAARRLVLVRPDEEAPDLPSGADTFAVVMTHSLKHDTAWARRLLAGPAAYVGVLGPRPRTQRILATLGVAEDARVFGPVGLDLGADGPEQVAVSIAAELLAWHAQREPGHLRERALALHAGA